ncbi:MAG: DsbA family protein [Novosphingobium sp.]
MRALASLLYLACSLGVLAAGAMAQSGWSRALQRTSAGTNVLGNPQAKVRLTQYVSYTCTDCARFQVEADAVLQLAYVPSGRLAIEVHHVIRSPIDLTAAMLANCGPKEKFFLNHSALLFGQARWLKPLVSATATQRRRWEQADLGARNRAIAADFRLYDLMATRGYDRQNVEQCLIDRAMAARLEAQSQAASAAGVSATPGFAINGKLLLNTHDWARLRPQLDESLK